MFIAGGLAAILVATMVAFRFTKMSRAEQEAKMDIEADHQTEEAVTVVTVEREQNVPEAVNPADGAPPLGSRCTVQLRPAAQEDDASALPQSVTGDLAVVNDQWVMVKTADHQTWIPREAVLLMRFDPG